MGNDLFVYMVPGNMGKSSPPTLHSLLPWVPSLLWSVAGCENRGEGKSKKETSKTHPNCFSHLPTSCPCIQPLLSFQISTLLLSFAPLPPVGLPASLIPGAVGSHSSASSGPFPKPASFLVLVTWSDGAAAASGLPVCSERPTCVSRAAMEQMSF